MIVWEYSLSEPMDSNSHESVLELGEMEAFSRVVICSGRSPRMWEISFLVVGVWGFMN
jgi:hypothetical protein